MNDSVLICTDEQRRHQVRKNNLNGLDYVEVSDDQFTLTVHLLGQVPPELTKENIRISGGRRITDVEVVGFGLCEQDGEENGDCFQVVVNKFGDFSNYTLSVVALDNGRPTNQPFPGFDQRYYQLEFTFKANCPSDLDCKPKKVCPPPVHLQPEINYLAKDYASFRQLILDRLSQIMPNWKERHLPDLGMALVETLAYVGDHLSYYQDAVATEAYLNTARRRISVRRHARLVDYAVHEGSNARAWVTVETSSNTPELETAKLAFVTSFPDAPMRGKIINMNHEDLITHVSSRSFEVFLPLFWNGGDQIKFYKDHNRIEFYTWDDRNCCLPRGATSATLRGQLADPANQQAALALKTTPAEQPARETEPPLLYLKEGDVLIFEEVFGPKTGDEDDADPGHRHAVRLTKVESAIDALHNKPVVEIAWAEEDALPFPLCISALGPAPECKLLENISVARGNVILVDHGRYAEKEPLGKVRAKSKRIICKKENRAAEIVIEAESFHPVLERGPLAFAQPLTPVLNSAADLIKNDPQQAGPQVWLEGVCSGSGRMVIEQWTAVPDLFGSLRRDCHFVVEMDNDGRGHLRFSDNDLGRMPEANTSFKARYRIGNGLSGNVGAEAIAHVVYPGLSGGEATPALLLTPRNPLPAQGGVEPQPLEEVKLFAPTAFRKKLERAVTADDYTRLAERHPKVQRASAALRWIGSWYEVLVAIDPFGQAEADQDLLDEIAGYLYRYRRMGHDLVVARARYVPLDIAMIVCAKPNYLRGHVKAALLEVFSDEVLSDGRKGFFHPDNLTFAQSIRLSKLIAEAQAVPGVESVTVTRLERLFQGPNSEIENGILPLNSLEIARVDNDPSFPENGRLDLEVRGGR